jgi:hypothetical protein
MTDAIALANKIAAERAVKAEEMRKQFPFCAQMVDELRQAGLQPIVRYAREGEYQIDRKRLTGVAIKPYVAPAIAPKKGKRR